MNPQRALFVWRDGDADLLQGALLVARYHYPELQVNLVLQEIEKLRRNTWLELKKKDGTIKQLYDYWILGKNAERISPRWCIARNVLHWIR